MAAAICGKRRSFMDDLPSSPTSALPPISKKIRRCSSTSPVRFSVAPSPTSLFDQLRAQFPNMDSQLIEKALVECGYNLDAAIKSLNEMQLGCPSADVETNRNMQNVPNEDPTLQCNLPVDGPGWVELLLKEMMSAASVDDARTRASRVLENLEKSISLRAGAGAESTENIQKENMVLKEQVEALTRDNTILKRAVVIQHERQKDHDDKSQEVQHLEQMVSQYQPQLSSLEVNNYALKIHLQQAQQGNAGIPGRFHPDVF